MDWFSQICEATEVDTSEAWETNDSTTIDSGRREKLFYTTAVGQVPDIYTSVEQARAQTNKFNGYVSQSCRSREKLEKFMKDFEKQTNKCLKRSNSSKSARNTNAGVVGRKNTV